MTKTLKIAPGVTLPLDMITQTVGIVAKRRVGKSYTARRVCEQVFQTGEQIVIVDPKGDHWGIRSSADGKGPGLPIVIIGGEHGDVPLEPSGGEVVAKLAAEDRVSMLLDLSLLRKHEVATFMAAFLETLYRLKAREQFRTPLLLMLEEADAIAPQKPPKGHERMLGAADDIVRRGGQRGIGVILVTQRSAVINKNVLTQCEMLVALRTIAPQDREALEAWIEVHGTAEQRDVLMASLASLPIGDAWFWSPGWPTDAGIFKRAHVYPIETFDSGKSPTAGETRTPPKKLADVDLAALTKQMADVVERKKRDDPKLLHAEIAKLQGELKKAGDRLAPAPPAPGASKDDLRTEYERGRGHGEDDGHRAGFGAGWVAGMQRAAEMTDAQFKHGIDDVITDLQDRRASIVDIIRQTRPDAAQVTASLGARAARSVATKQAKEIMRPPVSIPDRNDAIRVALDRGAPVSGWGDAAAPELVGDLSQQIVDVLGGMQDCRIATVPRVTVAAFVGMHPRTASFLDALKDVRVRGLVEDGPGGLALTDAGARARVGRVLIRSRADLHLALYRQLKELPARMLKYLIERQPTVVTRDELAGYIGVHPRTASFLDALDTLANLGVAKKVRGGGLVAGDILFPAGLPDE